MDDPVRDQYEAYPYPARDPRDEARRLITGSPSNLPEINHYLFAGRRDFARPFRALVAGGGTGDATVMLAQQLADTGSPGEVVHFDLSTASRAIAEARVEARRLTNVRFVTGQIEALPDLGLGRFDYVDCCGVLHHLEDPAVGLRALAAVLAETGGIGLMVYGEYGRSGLYPLQDALRRLGGALPLAQQVGLARRVIESLPPTNGFRRNPLLTDHRRSDAELVDLCLHARDRAYSVPQLLGLIEGAGLETVSLIEPIRYRPETYVRDGQVLKRLSECDAAARAAIAEVLAGNMHKHVAYAAPSSDGRIAQVEGPAAMPLLRDVDGGKLAAMLRRDPTLKAELDGLPMAFPMPHLAAAILAQIDGAKSLADLHAALRQLDSALTWDAFKRQFDRVYAVMNGLNRLLIHYPG